ncbi:MAG: NAD-dependent epimerase/dehydratase family protein [Alphaproteobacteria bacterium]|nr:NAD-dependent epimerase/dehydratase family protein [Alphaproteobacteria bacterium]
MRLLVTGGTGFVMSHVVRTWLERHPSASVVSVDIAPPDSLAERFFEPVRERLSVVTGDVRDPHLLGAIPGNESITHVVCGAAMTPTIGTTEKSQAAGSGPLPRICARPAPSRAHGPCLHRQRLRRRRTG